MRGRIVVIALVSHATAASAQPNDPVARADALFREGRALIEAGNFDAACPKFEESQRLDPGLGTLLNLAACYEQVGKLASALTAFRSAEEQARAAGPGEKKREQTASDRARALEGRVARLAVIVASAEPPAGFVVTRDGVPMRPLDFGRRVPVDPGTIVIAATAPGFEPFETEVAIARDTTARTVEIPALTPGAGTVDDAAPPATPDIAPPAGGADEPTPPASSRTRIAIGLAAAGVVGLGAGVGLGLSAKSRYDDVPCTQNGSPPMGCTAAEAARIDDARARGNLGTIVGGLGVAALAAGVVLYVTAPKGRAVVVAPVAGDGELGLTFAGRW